MIKAIAALMNASSNSSSPSAVELAERAHRNVFWWNMGWLVVAALVTLFFTWQLWKSSNRQQAAVKAESDARALKLEKDASDSKSAQQRVETDLAKAKEAQANAEKSLLELQKLIRESRTINWKRGNEILAAGPKGKVEIFFADGNQEAFNLAFSIHGLLTSNGWTASTPNWASGGIPSTGISIEVGGSGWIANTPNGDPMDGVPEPAKTLRKVLFESVEGNPGVTIRANQQLPDGTVEIMIGPKY